MPTEYAFIFLFLASKSFLFFELPFITRDGMGPNNGVNNVLKIVSDNPSMIFTILV